MTDHAVPSISVVIPTFDEGSTIARTLRAARGAFGPRAELIVVDGGSGDGTADIARETARVVISPRGRGQQLRIGSDAATGTLVVFLHADTRVEPEAAARVQSAFRDRDVVGACCRFAVDPPAAPFSRFALLERGVNLRTRLFDTATGDQVIVVRRDALEQVGGVPPIPLFEDVTLIRRLRRLGRFVHLDVTAHTSRRRWDERGFWPTVLQHLLLRAAFWLKIPPDRLARWYERRYPLPAAPAERTSGEKADYG